MGDAVAALGPTAITGDRADRAPDRVLDACYIVSSGAETTAIRLTAQGYLADHDTTVRADTVTFEQSVALVPVWKVEIAHIDADPDTASKCSPTATSPSSIQFGDGLRLGTPREEVERLIGPGWVEERGGARVYEHCARTIEPAGTVGVHPDTRIRVRYVGGAAANVQVRYMVSACAEPRNAQSNGGD